MLRQQKGWLDVWKVQLKHNGGESQVNRAYSNQIVSKKVNTLSASYHQWELIIRYTQNCDILMVYMFSNATVAYVLFKVHGWCI